MLNSQETVTAQGIYNTTEKIATLTFLKHLAYPYQATFNLILSEKRKFLK